MSRYEHAQSLIAAGTDREEVLGSLRAEMPHIGQAVMDARELFGISNVEAFDLVFQSETWRDETAGMDPSRVAALRGMSELADSLAGAGGGLSFG